MNRTHAKRILAGTLALACVLGGTYIGTARMARAAATNSLSAHAATRAQLAPRSGQAEESRSAQRTPPIVSEAASVLGIDAAELTKQLQAGKSLADAAKDRGISEADFTAKLLALRSARIDEAVKSGKLDAAKGEAMKQRMSEHLVYMVREKNLLEKHERHKGHGLQPKPEQLTAVLGVSKDELHKQLQAGKSIAEIAAAKGMSREQLIAKLKEQMTPQLERWVDRKHPAPAQAAK
jgi:hypothetical protein